MINTQLLIALPCEFTHHDKRKNVGNKEIMFSIVK